MSLVQEGEVRRVCTSLSGFSYARAGFILSPDSSIGEEKGVGDFFTSSAKESLPSSGLRH